MTDNEIIKALEYCTTDGWCSNCPHEKKCIEDEITKLALDLINRQKAEIDFVISSKNLAEASVNTLKVELDLAKAFHKEAVAERDLLNIQLGKAKAENEALYKINAQSTEEISELRKELCKRQNLEENFSKSIKQADKKLEKTVKLERAKAVKEVFKKLRAEYTERFLVSGDTVIEILNEAEKEMVGAESG